MIEPGINSIKPCVNFYKLLIDLHELGVDAIEPRVDFYELLVNFYELGVNAIEPRVNFYELGVNAIEPRVNLHKLRINAIEPQALCVEIGLTGDVAPASRRQMRHQRVSDCLGHEAAQCLMKRETLCFRRWHKDVFPDAVHASLCAESWPVGRNLLEGAGASFCKVDSWWLLAWAAS